MSGDNNIRQRAWYYSKVFVDPKNPDLVYCPNVNFMYSRDGGRTFQSYRTPHGDHHDLWIDPENGNRMVVADDGGGVGARNFKIGGLFNPTTGVQGRVCGRAACGPKRPVSAPAAPASVHQQTRAPATARRRGVGPAGAPAHRPVAVAMSNKVAVDR